VAIAALITSFLARGPSARLEQECIGFRSLERAFGCDRQLADVRGARLDNTV
jgi:hypothetical protein